MRCKIFIQEKIYLKIILSKVAFPSVKYLQQEKGIRQKKKNENTK